MADKEERILHIVQKLDGRFVGENRISAQEAIERIAKAICKISCACKYDACGNCTEFLEHYTPDLAEAALNALLEVQK